MCFLRDSAFPIYMQSKTEANYILDTTIPLCTELHVPITEECRLPDFQTVMLTFVSSKIEFSRSVFMFSVFDTIVSTKDEYVHVYIASSEEEQLITRYIDENDTSPLIVLVDKMNMPTECKFGSSTRFTPTGNNKDAIGQILQHYVYYFVKKLTEPLYTLMEQQTQTIPAEDQTAGTAPYVQRLDTGRY